MSISTFHNVVIYPYSELLDSPFGKSFHKGGPCWPNWSEVGLERHHIGSKAVDHEPEGKCPWFIKTIREPLLWCGAVTNHFGHQITDFSSRLISYDGMDGLYCFAVHPRSKIRSVDDCPGFFKGILQWFNIPFERVLIVHKPLRAKQIICAPQNERLGGILNPDLSYLDGLSTNTKRHIPSSEKPFDVTYVSRAGQRNGILAGESYLERLFESLGVNVIRPEKHNLSEQLTTYYKSKKIVFSEGSAVHALQLLGRGLGDVFILRRREGSEIAKNPLLKRVKSLHYLNYGNHIHGLNRIGKNAPELGITFPSMDSVSSLLNTVGLDSSKLNELTFSHEAKKDVLTWLKREKRSKRSSVPGSLEMIELSIQQYCGEL